MSNQKNDQYFRDQAEEEFKRELKGHPSLVCPVCKSGLAHMNAEFQEIHIEKCYQSEEED